MLPGFRILFALVVLSFAILIFGFGALALLRTAHQNLASQPAWQQDWRTPVEIASARRNDGQQAPGETQTLAMLRVEQLPAAQSEKPPAQLQGQDAEDKPALDAASDASVLLRSAPTIPAPAADTNDDDKQVIASAPVDVGASREQPADQTTSSAQPTNGPEKAADTGSTPQVADTQDARNDQGSPAAPVGPDTNAAPSKVSEGAPAPERTDAAAATPAPAKPEPPMKLAALPDTTTASSERKQQARQRSVRQPDAAERRAKRRARARLRARRLALAKARAARLAQTQQTTTNPSYYNSGFTTTGSSTTATAPNATPFGAPRTVP